MQKDQIRWTQKLVALTLIFGVYALFWHYYCGLDAIVHFFSITQEALKTRLVQAGENITPIVYMLSIRGLVFISVGMAAVYNWGDGKVEQSERRMLVALAVFWVLANQFRYAIYSVPCLAYLWAKQVDSRGRACDIATQWRILAVLLLSVVLLLRSLPINGFLYQVPMFRALPANARVLTFFNTSTFVLQALYPDVKVAPAMEVGFSTLSLQKFLKEHLDKRGLDAHWDCAVFRRSLGEFTYVVDTPGDYMLPNRPPECLKLEETFGAWRLWRILRS